MAVASWAHNPASRPSISQVLQDLNLSTESKRIIQARLKVVCNGVAMASGYVSRSVDKDSGSLVVTKNINDSLVVAWNADLAEYQLVSFLVYRYTHCISGPVYTDYRISREHLE